MTRLLHPEQFRPVFHGTLHRNVEDILRNGLRPSPGGNSGAGAYLSDSLEEGQEWARYAAWNNRARDEPLAVIQGHPIHRDALVPDRRRGDWVLNDSNLFVPHTVWHNVGGDWTSHGR